MQFTFQVLVADINIGYEDIVNTQVEISSLKTLVLILNIMLVDAIFFSVTIIDIWQCDFEHLNMFFYVLRASLGHFECFFTSHGPYLQVLAFNGKPVKNLKTLANMVESCKDQFLKFDLEYQQVCVKPRI